MSLTKHACVILQPCLILQQDQSSAFQQRDNRYALPHGLAWTWGTQHNAVAVTA